MPSVGTCVLACVCMCVCVCVCVCKHLDSAYHAALQENIFARLFDYTFDYCSTIVNYDTDEPSSNVATTQPLALAQQKWRPAALRDLLESLGTRYPGAAVIVLDDSKRAL